MSDCSDSDDSDYVPVEERELIIGSAIDTAKGYLQTEISNVWEYINNMAMPGHLQC